MTLRGNAGRLVQGVNNLSGFVSLTEGPGIEIIPNNARNSLQFGTVTAMLEFDDILANGDSTARSAKFLNNASDTIPALIVHNTLDFGNGAVAPGVTLKYSPGTPDGLVLGPTTGTDKKILRSDIIGANTSTAIVVKSGMTFDTGLTLTVDNLVAQTVSSNGDITAHRLLPYDANGLTINLDTCTMTCADSVANPRINIYPGLNCFGAITGSAGITLTGDLVLNNMITTPTLIVPIDLTLKPSGDVRVFSGKTLFCDTLSQSDTNSNFNITAVGTNKNIRITPSGTARTYFSGGVMMGYISNYYASDITIQPDSAKIILAAPVIASNITATNIITAANTNLNISPGTNGITDISSAVAIRDTLTVNTITSRTTNLALSATGTGTINLNSAVVGTHITTNILTSPATVNLTINSPAGTINTNATNITASGALSLTSNGTLNLQALTGNSNVNISGTGTGVINMLSTLLVNTIIPYNSSNLSLAASGTNGNVSLTATGTGTINLNSPTVGTTITATTFTAPPSSNLNINALGGSIITNAIRLAPTTSLTIAPATSLTFTPGSPAQFNCSVNVANDLTVTGSLNGTGLTNTITNGNLALAANGTGTINLNSPTVGTNITATTITSPALTNLTINSPGGIINTNATNITASGALSLASNGALNLQALTGNSSVNISGTGTGTINLNSPTVGTTITATTFTAPPLSNLNINAAGGSILSNALNWSATGTLGINSGGTMTLWPTNNQCIIDATLTVNRSIIGSRFVGTEFLSNVLNTGISLSPNGTGQVNVLAGKTLTADTISSTTANTNLILTPNGTGSQVKIATGKTLATDAISSNAATAIAIKNDMTFDATKTLTVDNIISKSISNNGNIVASKLIKNIGDGLTIDLDNSTITCTDATLPILIEPHLQVNGILTCTSNAIIYNGLATTTLTPYNSTGLTINLNNSTLSSATPINISSIVANTISSAAATNLTINTPGGTINTNATNITASGTSPLAINANGVSFNTGSVACTFYNDISIVNANLISSSGIIKTSNSNTNMTLTTTGTGYVSIPNTGIRLPNGSSTLNWYEEATLSSAWVNVVTNTPTNTTTLYVVRIGKQVFITLVSNNPIMPTTDIGVPTMQTNLVSKYSPVATFTQFNGSSYSIQISTAGVITLGNFVNTVAITPIMNFSYFTNN